MIALARRVHTNNFPPSLFLLFLPFRTLITAEAATLPTALIMSLLPWSTRGTPFAPGEHPLFEGPEPLGSGVILTTGGDISSAWRKKQIPNLPLCGSQTFGFAHPLGDRPPAGQTEITPYLWNLPLGGGSLRLA